MASWPCSCPCSLRPSLPPLAEPLEAHSRLVYKRHPRQLLARQWKQHLRVWLPGIAMAHSARHPPHHYNALYARTIHFLHRTRPLILYHTVQACDPQNFEPNLALNLEISDLINSKKGST